MGDGVEPRASALTGVNARRGERARVRILFVCLGNICRSPTAEGVMRALVHEAGLEEAIELDSAGTGDWHVGEGPDARAVAAARRRGVELQGAARQVRAEDFDRYDMIIAMDRSNLRDLRRLAPDARARTKVELLLDYVPGGGRERDVPDPYHGGARGFDDVFDLVRAACASLLGRLQAVDGDAVAIDAPELGPA